MAGLPLTIRIVASALPGATFGDRRGVRVGLQVKKEISALVAGDARRAVWETQASVVDGSIRGPAIHGPAGERFLYLSWVSRAPGGADEMFRRAKLQLDGVPAALLGQALKTGAPLVATLGLTDAKGGPLCASVRPPLVTWSVAGR